MKLIKVKTTITQKDGVTYRAYPPEYDATKINVLCYGDEQVDPADYEYCICAVDDEYAPELLKAKVASEIDEVETLAFGEKHRPAVEVINNPKAVIDVVKKVVKSEVLSKEDLAVLDPTNTKAGIIKTPTFTERFNVLKV